MTKYRIVAQSRDYYYRAERKVITSTFYVPQYYVRGRCWFSKGRWQSSGRFHTLDEAKEEIKALRTPENYREEVIEEL